ncbi:MAG: putative secreted protein [Fibrobacteres bacterium]|nr:putative secreted protein [Fibrobacterota bacterium]
MKHSRSSFPFRVLPLFLFVFACTNDPGDDGKPATGTHATSGSFQVSLVAPTDISQGFTSVLGKVYTGPAPSSLIWEEAAKSGECRLLKPRVPFCEQSCGSGAICVEDNQCRDFPKSVGIGRVSVTGLKTKSGAVSFAMDPVVNSYQPTGGIILDFPPFAEGDAVTFSASGDTGASAFTVSAVGISPLEVLTDSLTLADGKPISLEWTPPKSAGATVISVAVDISHHGGIKGKIECEGPDDGKLEIAAALVDQLKALGVSGYPNIGISRKATSTNAAVHVDLVLESGITKALIIPGLISCEDNDGCPDGQTCQKDLQCK